MLRRLKSVRSLTRSRHCTCPESAVNEIASPELRSVALGFTASAALRRAPALAGEAWRAQSERNCGCRLRLSLEEIENR